jgi:hypothetical protein
MSALQSSEESSTTEHASECAQESDIGEMTELEYRIFGV